jgi:hypothetical protein
VKRTLGAQRCGLARRFLSSYAKGTGFFVRDFGGEKENRPSFSPRGELTINDALHS